MKKEGAIVQKEHPALHKKAEAVSPEEIKSRRVETIIRRMQKALLGEEDGVAIAAPQIGESLRIFVVSKRVFEIMQEIEEEQNKQKANGSNVDTEKRGAKILKNKREFKDLVFINPEILKASKETMLVEEGCLSVRWLYGQVKRARKVLVRAYDENGKPFTFGGSGLLAQVFQHEIDHLDGILFTDKAKNLKEVPPQEMNHD